MNALRHAERWAQRHPLRLGRVPLTVLLLRFVERFLEVRVVGLAAEMTYYALLSILPLIAAVGASLGFLQRIAGEGAAIEMERAIVASLGLVFSAEVTGQIVAPLVRGLLEQERAGFALGGVLLSLLLASRVFRSAIDTLDAAYTVEERRGFLALWWRGFLFAILSIVTITTIVSMVVVGPLLGGGRALAEGLGLGRAFEVGWTVARWPVVFGIATGFLATLYRAGPNVRNSWRQSIPGALFGVVALVLVAIGLRAYLQVVGTSTPGVATEDEAVEIALLTFGAVLATLLWLWLSSMAVLAGGVLNAELSRIRRDMPAPQA